MATISTHTTRAAGTILTAAIYQADHGVHETNAQNLNTQLIVQHKDDGSHSTITADNLYVQGPADIRGTASANALMVSGTGAIALVSANVYYLTEYDTDASPTGNTMALAHGNDATTGEVPQVKYFWPASINFSGHLPAVITQNVISDSVTNSTSETTIFSASIPGGILGTRRTIRYTGLGDMIYNTGGTGTIQVRFKYGGLAFAVPAQAPSPSSARRNVRLSAEVQAQGSASSQYGYGLFELGSAAGLSGSNSAPTFQGGAHNAMTVDSTTAQQFVVTVELNIASANFSFAYRSAMLEIL